MRSALICTGLALLALQVPVAKAQDSNAAAWKELTDDVSRGELFERFVVPAMPEIRAKAFALEGAFLFPTHAIHDRGKPRTNAVFGIDVSHHNGPIDFNRLRAQEVLFVYAKATQGVGFRDPMFLSHWSALGALPRDQRIRRGGYHFLSAGSQPLEQAKSYLSLIKAAGGLHAEDLPPVLDLEWDVAKGTNDDRWASQTADQIVDKAIAWLRHVSKSTDRTPVLYTSAVWLRQRGISGKNLERLCEFPLWVADYSKSRRAIEVPNVPSGCGWRLWQFTDRARLSAGYGGVLDANVFLGTSAEFEGFLGSNRGGEL